MAKKYYRDEDIRYRCIVRAGHWCYVGRIEHDRSEAIRYALSNRECVAITYANKEVIWVAHGQVVIVGDSRDMEIIRRRGVYEFCHRRYTDVLVIQNTIDSISSDDLNKHFTLTDNGYIAKVTCSLCDAPLMDDSEPSCVGGRVCYACESKFKRSKIPDVTLYPMREHKYHHTFKVEHTLADCTVINYPVPLTAGGKVKLSKQSA